MPSTMSDPKSGPGPLAGVSAVLLFAALALAPCAYAQEDGFDQPPGNFVEDVSNAGTSAAAFLQIGVGARAQAMGNASAASVQDATALFWNPSAIIGLPGRINLAFDHTNWLADTRLDYLGAVFRLGASGAFGFTVMSFEMVDEQPVRTILQPEGTGEFYSASNLVLSASYAMALTDRFAAGLTGKYVQESLWNEQASALAVDVGITYRAQLPGLTLAASITNFGGDLQLGGRDLLRPYDDDPENFSNDKLNARLDTDSFSLPLHFRFGLAYAVIRSDMHRLTLATDLLHPSDNTESVNVGAEYTFWNTVSFRGGFVALLEADRTGGNTLGLGVQRRLPGGLGFAADYTYADWGILDVTHRLSLALYY